MTMVACGRMIWPRPALVSGGTQAAVSLTLDSTSDALAWVGKAPITDTLSELAFHTGTVTTGADVDVRIETVSNGRPTGTLWAANTNKVVTVADSDDNVWKTATLTSGASLNAGDEFAIVIASSAGTPNMILNGAHVGCQAGAIGALYPVLLQNASGSYAVINPGTTPAFQWVAKFSSAGVKYMPGMVPIDGAMTAPGFGSGSIPDEYALRFQVPFKCRLVGARAFIYNRAAGSAYTISLWDATGDTDAEALGQVSQDGDFPASAAADGYDEVYFPDPVVLEANTTYYIGVRADATPTLGLLHMSAAGTGAMANAIKAFSAESTELYVASRTWTTGTAGAWSTTTTTLPGVELVIDQIDDGAGGAGLNPLNGMLVAR